MDSDAIPPSSPPHASTLNVPSSPLFDAHFTALSPKSSSPPPLFSSDDSRESVDVTNYESPRIYKNKRKGAWWDNGESVHNTPEPKKTKMSRNYDSGVYMMSDATDSSEDLLPQHKSPFPFESASEEEPSRMSEAESAFCSQLRTGLEGNLEVYEWEGLNLEDGDINQIGHLASVIKSLPDPGNDLPAEGQYRSMVPELYINLSRNKLSRLTPSLFNVQSLTTLILRANQIEELPPQIGQLRNLKTLDLSLNKLQYLPFEVLRLLQPYGSLQRLTTMGNPLLVPMSSARFSDHAEIPRYYSDVPLLHLEKYDANRVLPGLYDSLPASADQTMIVWRIRFHEAWANSFGGADEIQDENSKGVDPGLYHHHPALQSEKVTSSAPRFIARTLVSYFDQIGNVIKGSSILPAPNEEDYPVIVETNRGTYGVPASPWFTPPSTSRVSSLVTTSLHNVLKKRHNDDYTIADLRDMLSEPIPSGANAIFSKAMDNDAGGFGEFRQCHTCQKDYVISRAEWIEFWSAGYAVFYPLKVKVCSWGCVPEEMRKRPEKELVW